MSRRIVEIAAIAGGDVTSGEPAALFALDNNGVAWQMARPCTNATWVRLPPLPSLENLVKREGPADE